MVLSWPRSSAYLGALERSPNTVRAYAMSLRLWFEFLGQAGVGWAEAGVEDVARFVAWLRAPAGNVIVLERGTGRRSPAAGIHHTVSPPASARSATRSTIVVFPVPPRPPTRRVQPSGLLASSNRRSISRPLPRTCSGSRPVGGHNPAGRGVARTAGTGEGSGTRSDGAA